jgi:hypothetical protein
VHGKSEEDGKFTVQTESHSVNRHGVLFPMEQIVSVGQHLKLVNDHTTQSVECHVVSVRRARDGKTYVGVEFTHPEANFWHMAFPIPGERPLRRQIQQSKASA